MSNRWSSRKRQHAHSSSSSSSDIIQTRPLIHSPSSTEEEEEDEREGEEKMQEEEEDLQGRMHQQLQIQELEEEEEEEQQGIPRFPPSPQAGGGEGDDFVSHDALRANERNALQGLMAEPPVEVFFTSLRAEHEQHLQREREEDEKQNVIDVGGEGEFEYRPPEPTYCYMCDTIEQSSNVYRQNINRVMHDYSHCRSNELYYCIAVYYQNVVQRINNDRIWPWSMVKAHYTEHVMVPTLRLVNMINVLEQTSALIQQTLVKKTRNPTTNEIILQPPNNQSIRSLCAVMNQQAKLLQLLQNMQKQQDITSSSSASASVASHLV